jgi:hypothetical protein
MAPITLCCEAFGIAMNSDSIELHAIDGEILFLVALIKRGLWRKRALLNYCPWCGKWIGGGDEVRPEKIPPKSYMAASPKGEAIV